MCGFTLIYGLPRSETTKNYPFYNCQYIISLVELKKIKAVYENLRHWSYEIFVKLYKGYLPFLLRSIETN